LRWGALAAALLVGARLAYAEAADPVAIVERAAKSCQDGNLEDAEEDLRALLQKL